jgi:hypothetical protein
MQLQVEVYTVPDRGPIQLNTQTTVEALATQYIWYGISHIVPYA